MKIFLVAGRAGSGKGEVAKIIEEYYLERKKKPITTEFSKYLKMYAREILNWDGNDPKPRAFLQNIGVTIRENMDMPTFLIDRMMQDLRVYALYFDVAIISDVRLPEEIEAIKKNFSDVASIYVINQFGKSTLSIDEQKHITETALEDYNKFDVTITNDNLNVLDNRVIAFLESRE